MHKLNRWLAPVALLALVSFAGPVAADEVEEGAAPPQRVRPTPSPQPAPSPAPMAAPAASECTWLPDIRCGRHGRWDGFHMPIIAPYYFEDPFITTGVTPYYLWHEFPGDSALQGGDWHVLALQARVALTDRLAFIATKDGYGWLRPGNPLVEDDSGWFNLGFGLKYAFLELPDQDFIASISTRFEVPSGSREMYQGHGSAQVMPSLSAAWGPGDLRLIGDIGGVVPFDGGDHSTIFFYHAYASYNLHEHFAPFVQFSGLQYTGSGDGTRGIKTTLGTLPLGVVQTALGTGPFEGVDVANLGSAGVSGNNVTTFAVGFHVPINRHVTWSAGYEFPISSREDLFEQRVTTALQVEF